MIPESAAGIRTNQAPIKPPFRPLFGPYLGHIWAKIRLKYPVLRPKVEPRHGFTIPLLIQRFAVLDSGSIEQNIGAQELRLPQARDAI
jgi:hypothetical protein